MTTPCFPAFRSWLAPLGRRTAQTVRQATLAQLQQHLRDFLPAPLLATEDDGVNSRERIFSLRLTLECFLWQMLKPRTSCREVVRQVQALFRLRGLGPVDEGDSAYVQARQRLPRERLEKALAATAQAADRRVERSAHLQGRTVKVVDGSTTQLADTPENQKRFPQPSSQKPGCGFPVIRFIALLSLTSGAMLQVVWSGLPHNHDLRLFRHLWPRLQTGDIVLGDQRPSANTPQPPPYPGKGWIWSRACITSARWIFARPNASLKTTVCLCGPKAISSRSSSPPSSGRFCPRKSPCASSALPPRFGVGATAASRWSPRCWMQTLPSRPTRQLVRPALATGIMLPRHQGHPGHGTVALQVTGHDGEGIAGVSGGPQLNPLRHGGGHRAFPSEPGTDQLQRRSGCTAPIQLRHRSGPQPKDAPATLGGFIGYLGSRCRAAQTQPQGAARRQTPAQSLSTAQPTAPPLRRNLSSQPILERQTPQLSRA